MYGAIILIILYLTVQAIYSVYYTPGVRTLYNSPVTQQLFPNAMDKLFPTWGYNKVGAYDGQVFKFGPGQFYPESGPSYKPNKYGYGGPSPEGGERKSLPIPKEVPVGWWAHSPEPKKPIHINIVGSDTIPEQTEIQVGWWND